MDEGISDEQALLAAAARGDRGAFGALVQCYQRRAYAVAYSYVRNRDDAMELAQESFARAFRAIRGFRGERPFYPWLYRIIRNACLNHLKRKRRRSEESLDRLVEAGFDVAARQAGPGDKVEIGELRERIWEALEQLTPAQREILRLRHLLEFSYAEIAETLGIPQGTVMSRLHAARRSLRAVLEVAEVEEGANDSHASVV
jgi:RNA polymerase sigma-70 factor (ECF subfamily)